MPFTLAHPFFALPLVRVSRKLPLSALMIGSMTPDLSIFLPYAGMHYEVNHSIRGTCTVDLATGLAIYALFHGLLKYPLLTLLPAPAARRLLSVAQATRFPPRLLELLLIVVALVVGALTHIGVDDCTHGYGWPAKHLALLRFSLPLFHVPLYKGLQYGLSALGLLGLAWAYRRWAKSNPTAAHAAEYKDALRPLPPRASIAVSAAITLLVALGCGFAYTIAVKHALTPPLHIRRVVAYICVGATPPIVLAMSIYASLWRYRHAKSDVHGR